VHRNLKKQPCESGQRLIIIEPRFETSRNFSVRWIESGLTHRADEVTGAIYARSPACEHLWQLMAIKTLITFESDAPHHVECGLRRLPSDLFTVARTGNVGARFQSVWPQRYEQSRQVSPGCRRQPAMPVTPTPVVPIFSRALSASPRATSSLTAPAFPAAAAGFRRDRSSTGCYK
jgi:hypothetical protein